MAKRVFVSYSRADADAVAKLVSDLEGLEHTAWMDHDLTGGQQWWDEVLRNIRESDLFVFALSEHSRTSKACTREYDYAVRLRKPVLPVVVEGGFSESLLPEAMARLQRVDYTRADEGAWKPLNRAIGSIADAPTLPEPLPEPPPIPATYMFDLSQEIESPEEMSPKKQDLLISQLKQQMAESDDARAILTVIDRFRQREDLLRRVDTELAELETEVRSGAPVGGQQESTASREAPQTTVTEKMKQLIAANQRARMKAPPPQQQADTGRARRRSTFFWIAVVGVVIILIIVIMLIVFSQALSQDLDRLFPGDEW